MMKSYNPESVARPFSNYVHAVEAPGDARWLFVSGQLGVAKDGSVPEDFAAQAEQAFSNVLAILEEAGMGTADIVRINSYLTDANDIAAYRAIRDRMLDNQATASTMLVVAGLAGPRYRIEVEAVAAKA
jgi:enamine deaminase RidA (YjgF/YER057c/UK114 family)